MTESDDVIDLPVLDEDPKEWIDGEEILEEESKKLDPEVLRQGERLGANTEDWVEE